MQRFIIFIGVAFVPESSVASLQGNSKNYKGGEGFTQALLGGSILVNMSWLFFRMLSGLVHGSSSHEKDGATIL